MPRHLHRIVRHRLVAGAVASLGAVSLLIGTPAHAAEPPYTSVFAESETRFIGAGWSACPEPITWDVDTSALSTGEARRQLATITWALEAWGEASGLTFTYTGSTPMTYDDATFSLRSARSSRDAAPAPRHISLAFLPQQASARLSDRVVALGSPSAVLASRNEITSGTAVFSADHLRRASREQARAVVLHELGHVLGLGHVDDPDQAMTVMVDDRTALGAGDIAGIRALTRPCRQ